jgi:transposase
MSTKERNRLTILTQVCEGHFTVADAAELLSISERQTYRILQRFRAEGAKGLLHHLRGHPSNRGYDKTVRQRVVQLYWQDYRDYGPTLFSEKLMEHHRLQINHETVRRWLMANGGTNLQRKKRLHRKKRPRHRTHQDRLVKELRERGISTIAEANRFLAAEYLDKHNQHFAVTENLADVHRSIEGYHMDNIFCFQTERHVRNDYTISLGGQYIQLLRGTEPLPFPRHSVTVRRYLDDTLHIFWKDLELSFEILDHQPIPKPRTIVHPAATHPWRRSLIGKARYA